ncbi:MAG: hypothetical protein ABJN26_05380 [Stappiaceae bacterium]
MHRQPIIAVLVTVALSLPVAAETMHMVSRESRGEFHGSQRVFTSPASQYKAVEFCDRTYWVDPFSVAWAHWETENRRAITIEHVTDDGWRIVCHAIEEKVSLKDFGIEEHYASYYNRGVRAADKRRTITRLQAAFSYLKKNKSKEYGLVR